jgi:hypothetical protein
MAAPHPTGRTVQPPPDLPSMPDVSTTLSSYLRNFALWCRHGFADKLSGTTALPGVMLQAYDAPAGTTPKVYLVQVNSAGAISATLMTIGAGKP